MGLLINTFLEDHSPQWCTTVHNNDCSSELTSDGPHYKSWRIWFQEVLCSFMDTTNVTLRRSDLKTAAELSAVWGEIPNLSQVMFFNFISSNLELCDCTKFWLILNKLHVSVSFSLVDLCWFVKDTHLQKIAIRHKGLYSSHSKLLTLVHFVSSLWINGWIFNAQTKKQRFDVFIFHEIHHRFSASIAVKDIRRELSGEFQE